MLKYITLNTVKIRLIDFLSEYYFLIVAIFILGIYLSPNIFFQNNAHFLIHDNLDQPYAIMFFYQTKERLSYQEINEKTIQLFEKWIAAKNINMPENI